MNEQEKLKMLEEMLEVDENTLTSGTVLDDLEEWDSIAVLSLIALLDDEFDIEIKGSTIREFETVADILSVMNK